MSPVVLVILIAWALLSVMFLTGTLLAARSIDRSVAIIKPNVDEIGTDAGFIEQAKTIEETSAKIRAAAAPLSGSLADTLEVTTKGIDPKLKSILGKVKRINSVAGDINGTVLQIGSTVDGIFGSVSSINDSATSVAASAKSILSDVREVNASSRSILANAGSILSRVNSIDEGVALIVKQSTEIGDVAKTINQDSTGIDANVGQEGRGGAFGSHIVGHANSIDCSAVLAVKTAGDACKR